MNEFNWGRAFSNLDTCHATLKNIIANFIAHDAIICDDRDSPQFNNRIKKSTHERNNLYKDYRKNHDTHIFEKLALLQKEAREGGRKLITHICLQN